MTTPTQVANQEAALTPDLAINKDIVRRWFQAMESGSLEEVQMYWAPDATNHGSARPGLRLPSGGDGIAMVARMLRTAFPDRSWQIDDIIAEGDMVDCRMTLSGTFGTKPEPPPFPEQPGSPGVEATRLIDPLASGRPYSVKHMYMFRIANGKIAEHWATRDDLGLLLQLGSLPLPQPATSRG